LKLAVISETVCGIAPTAIFVVSILFRLTTVAAAVIDEGSWIDIVHFDFLENKLD
jgi:hypothetical protein